MTYLLDTNVVSALRKPDRNPEVRTWAVSVPPAELFVAANTIAEIERGVIAKERTDPTQGEVLRDRLRTGYCPPSTAECCPSTCQPLAFWPPIGYPNMPRTPTPSSPRSQSPPTGGR